MIKLVKGPTSLWHEIEDAEAFDKSDLSDLLDRMPEGAIMIVVVPGEDEPDLGEDTED